MKKGLEPIIEQIQLFKKFLLTANVGDVIREAEVGSKYALVELKEPFLHLKELLTKIDESVLYDLPEKILTNLVINLSSIKGLIDNIQNFEPTQPNANQVKTDLIKGFETYYNNLFQDLIYAFALVAVKPQKDDFSKKESFLNEAINKVKSLENEAQTKLAEIEKILENAQAAAGKIGISKYATIFHDEAKEHSELAKAWLNRSYGFLGGIALFAVLAILMLFIDFINNSIKEGGNTFLIQLTISKAIILAALFYGLSICTRNYKAHRHNAVVNKHRQNALTTFEVFSEAADSDQTTKNAVLLEATRTIFSSQQTGYLNNESEGESPNKVIEIIKSVTSTSK